MAVLVCPLTSATTTNTPLRANSANAQITKSVSAVYLLPATPLARPPVLGVRLDLFYTMALVRANVRRERLQLVLRACMVADANNAKNNGGSREEELSFPWGQFPHVIIFIFSFVISNSVDAKEIVKYIRS